jgi:predicted nucleic acid-binding protein
MKPRVYIETSVISYLTSEPSRDLVVAAHQQITRDWWRTAEDRFDLYVSDLVLQEARMGDPAAAKRLAAVEGLAILDVGPEATDLARELVERGPLSARAEADALHIAEAVVNGMDYLLSWNCAHIANARMRKGIAGLAGSHDYDCPAICTPDELLEG